MIIIFCSHFHFSKFQHIVNAKAFLLFYMSIKTFLLTFGLNISSAGCRRGECPQTRFVIAFLDRSDHQLRAHNPKVGSSNLPPATTRKAWLFAWIIRLSPLFWPFVSSRVKSGLVVFCRVFLVGTRAAWRPNLHLRRRRLAVGVVVDANAFLRVFIAISLFVW